MGGFGPRRPEWGLFSVANIGFPFLAVLGTEPEQMGWGTRPSDLAPYLPAEGEVVEVEDVGHFVHIEKPRLVADLTLEFLAR
jgi:pimeloyl-ACP methyl ester carboxylesterase